MFLLAVLFGRNGQKWGLKRKVNRAAIHCVDIVIRMPNGFAQSLNFQGVGPYRDALDTLTVGTKQVTTPCSSCSMSQKIFDFPNPGQPLARRDSYTQLEGSRSRTGLVQEGRL
jgi:hypothetical protein